MSMISIFSSRSSRDPYDLDQYEREVVAGLPNEMRDLDEAIQNQALYDLDAVRYIPRREAETPFDWEGRPKRECGLTRQIVDILTEHLYSPGPQRVFSDSVADEFLQKIWKQNNYNALWHKCDQLSTLNDNAAVQVDAGEGNFEECPLTLRPWQREEFCVWTHPDDSRVVVAICTIDRYDMTTTFRLWNQREVRTYQTLKGNVTAGGRAPTRLRVEPHEYGILPFYFAHYELPTTRFHTPGLGSFTGRAELRINDRLSRLDESIVKHLNPVPVAENVPKDWFPIMEPQRFIRLISSGKVNTGASGYQPMGDPKLYYLSPTIDVAGAWSDNSNYLMQVLEACRIPRSAYRMEQSGTASGISLVFEQLPLLTRAKKRRHAYSVFEGNAAKTQLICAGNHYGIPQLVEAAKSGTLLAHWPEYTLPVGTLDKNNLDKSDLALGVKSLIQVIQDRHGVTRDQAIVMLEQIQQDKIEEARIAALGSGLALGSEIEPVVKKGTKRALVGPRVALEGAGEDLGEGPEKGEVKGGPEGVGTVDLQDDGNVSIA